MDLQTVRIAVVGTGAVGASVAADLTRADLDVTLIDPWPQHVEAMRADGLTIHLPDQVQVTPVRAHHVCEVAELRAPYDLVLTAVKSYDTGWVCELMAPLLHEDSAFVGLQNGMTTEAVSRHLGPARTIGAVVGIAANAYEPGIVVRQIPPAGTWFAVGALSGERTRRVEQVAAALAPAGTVEVTDDIHASKWMKLLANIPEMLPSAIVDAPLMVAAGMEELRPLMDASAREAYALARELGVRMRPIFGQRSEDVADSDQYAVDLLDAVLDQYSAPDTRVAVLQDWDKGRRAELDAFNGYIVAESARIGRDAPVNAMFLDLAVRIERGELTPSIDNLARLTEAAERARR